MSDRDSLRSPRLARDPERRMLFGVCAGLAKYFGFDLTITRVLTVIAALFFLPSVLIAYLVCALLMPAGDSAAGNGGRGAGRGGPGHDESGRHGPSHGAGYDRVRNEPHDVLATVRYRFRDLDARLQKLEKYVTSERFQLDAEFRKLK
jgi:phage shock protein C